MMNPRFNYLIKKTTRYLAIFFKKARKNIVNIVLFFILLSLFTVLTYLIASFSSKGEERRRVLDSKRAEVNELKRANTELKNKAEFYESKRYVEEQARNVLGWSYNGEKEIIIDGLKAEITSTPIPQEIVNENKKEPIDKWINLVFD